MRPIAQVLLFAVATSWFAPITSAASRADARPPSPRILIGSPDLLRNDEITTNNPVTPAKGTIFTSGCSSDPAVSLDKGDPAGCAASIEGEGVSTPGNGSDDADDYYIRNFTPPVMARIDPDLGLLSDTSRPLIYYQVENACDKNGLLMIKERVQGTVSIYLNNAVACPLGACCDAVNGCVDGRLEFECVDSGGVFNGDGTLCASTPCTGACCTAVQPCQDGLSQAACLSLGGVYQGDVSSCSATPCVGACCLASGNCTADTDPACVAAGGVYQGDTSVCGGGSCQSPVGACCTTAGCSIATSAACAGVYRGDGSTCSSAPCTGACCDPVLGCVDDQLQTDCQLTGGTYEGNNTICTANSCTGACCNPTGGCVDSQTPVNCQNGGGTYIGNGTLCSSNPCDGACCSLSQGCQDGQSTAACQAIGGTHQGIGSSCTSNPCVGACCDSVRGCTDGETSAACQAAGGTSQGATSTCAANPCVGACCSLAQGCVNGQLQTACTAIGGQYLGDATNCTTSQCRGACCDAARGCTDGETSAECLAAGGTYRGDLTLCSSDPCPGACCSAALGCRDNQLLSACQAIGGVFLGPSSTCAQTPCGGACCDPTRGCTDGETSAACQAAGGVYQGDLSTCASLTCTGACCNAQLGCNDLTSAACGQQAGTVEYLGDGTQCATANCPVTGACCEVFGCQQDYQSGCSGYYFGDNSSCAGINCADYALGACCDDVNSTCNNIIRQDCVAPRRFVDGDLCSPDACHIGACCSVTFGCSNNQSPESCDDIAGATVFLGDGTVCGTNPCPPTGACCGVFGCTSQYQAACVGVYAGDGVSCSPDPCPGLELAACCNDALDTCSDISHSACDAAGGRFVSGDLCGPNTCDVGACCSPVFACQDNWTPEQCRDRAGPDLHLGDGTTCGPSGSNCPPRGACCTLFGCQANFEVLCIGTFMGPGTTCGTVQCP